MLNVHGIVCNTRARSSPYIWNVLVPWFSMSGALSSCPIIRIALGIGSVGTPVMRVGGLWFVLGLTLRGLKGIERTIRQWIQSPQNWENVPYGNWNLAKLPDHALTCGAWISSLFRAPLHRDVLFSWISNVLSAPWISYQSHLSPCSLFWHYPS